MRGSVLLIEDEPDIRESVADALEIEGVKVLTASNGREGIELLKTIPAPDLILLDLWMPVTNGWEFLDLKKGDRRLAPIPTVLLSAYPVPNEHEGVEGFIKKPIDLDALLATVNKFCTAPEQEATKPNR